MGIPLAVGPSLWGRGYAGYERTPELRIHGVLGSSSSESSPLRQMHHRTSQTARLPPIFRSAGPGVRAFGATGRNPSMGCLGLHRVSFLPWVSGSFGGGRRWGGFHPPGRATPRRRPPVYRPRSAAFRCEHAKPLIGYPGAHRVSVSEVGIRSLGRGPKPPGTGDARATGGRPAGDRQIYANRGMRGPPRRAIIAPEGLIGPRPCVAPPLRGQIGDGERGEDHYPISGENRRDRAA